MSTVMANVDTMAENMVIDGGYEVYMDLGIDAPVDIDAGDNFAMIGGIADAFDSGAANSVYVDLGMDVPVPANTRDNFEIIGAFCCGGAESDVSPHGGDDAEEVAGEMMVADIIGEGEDKIITDVNIIGAFTDEELTGAAAEFLGGTDIHGGVTVHGGTDDFVGGMTKYRNDKTAPAQKDAVIRSVMNATVGECMGDVCMSRDAEKKVLDVVGAKTIADAKISQKCETETCLLKKLEPKLGPQLVSAELQNNFKHNGPTDNALLSNVHIDNVMKWFSRRWPEFYPYNFNMSNYIDYSYVNGRTIPRPDTLATVSLLSLLNGGHNGVKYKMAGCVINDDTYQGPGTHWMALFMDGRTEGEVSIEFFNSAGNKPRAPWVNWLCKNKAQLEGAGLRVKEVRVSEIRHQHSMTECGVYSLFYIYCRIRGVNAEYFLQNPVQDQIMFEFRQHMFKGERGVIEGKFDWTAYTKQVGVKWE